MHELSFKKELLLICLLYLILYWWYCKIFIFLKLGLLLDFKKILTIENTPDKVQTRRDTLTLPVFLRTPEGETNMPEPIILPTITVIPFSRVILGLRVISSSGLLSPSMARAVLQESTTLGRVWVRRLPTPTTPRLFLVGACRRSIAGPSRLFLVHAVWTLSV